MKGFFPRWLIYLLVFVLYVFHNDLWLWDDPTLIAGLPVGFFYHLCFCVAAAGLMVLLVNYAWPDHLEEGVSASTDGDEGASP